MKKVLVTILLLLTLTGIIYFARPIQDWIIKNYIFNEDPVIEEANKYFIKNTFDFVQDTNNFDPQNKQELRNIIFTILNSGWDEFAFYCEYDGCMEDINVLSADGEYSLINNFVHPFNSYNKINITTNTANRIKITIEKTYTEEEINLVNAKIDDIVANNITEEMTTKEKIITFHNYIINTTAYDTKYIDDNIVDNSHPSHKAIGPLFYNKALCGGYTDVMAIYLNRLGIKNYKVSSEQHIWNIVYFEKEWLHLDLTWDDPVTSDGQNILHDHFLLITTKELEELKTGFHDYDKQVFIEAK